MPHSPRALLGVRPRWRRFPVDKLTLAWAVAMLGLVFASAWMWHLNHVALSPPTDNIEQLTWMRSLEWGYYKHPPLPTWLLWAATQVTGWSAHISYWLGALCTMVAIALAASVTHDCVGPRFAWVSVLATLCITFYNGRLNYYNHNTVLTLWVALSAWLWWRLLTRPHLKWWLWLGVVAGLGTLTKYQFVVVGVASLWLVVRLGLWREPLHRQGLLLCMVVGALLAMPHGLWLQSQHHTPMDYAVQSSLGAHLGGVQRLSQAGLWLADWLFNRSLLAVVLILGVWALAVSGTERRSLPRTRTPLPPAHWHLLMAWGVVPPAFMVLLSLSAGIELQLHWGTAFAVWTPPALMLALGLREQHLQRRALQWALGCFLVAQALLLALSHRTSALGTHPSNPPHWRQFPAQALAQAIAEPARHQLRGPIDIISGPASASGALALLLPEQPRVLIDGDPSISPWIDSHGLAGQRILELWPPGTEPTHAMPAPHGWHWTTADHPPDDTLPAMPWAAGMPMASSPGAEGGP